MGSNVSRKTKVSKKMKIPRNISLGLAGLAFTAWMTWAVKPRYDILPSLLEIPDLAHSQLKDIAIARYELPHMPFVHGIRIGIGHVGEQPCAAPFTYYFSHDGKTCSGIDRGGVTFCGYQLRSARLMHRGRTAEETAACVAADTIIQKYSAEVEMK